MIEFHDTLILDRKARRLRTGELAANVRCARAGLQDYLGSEVGRPDLERVTVYRPETEVMRRDSIASFAGVPVTVEHPREAVTTDNWKQYAVGETGDEVLRDGEFIRVPILVRDENAIRAIEDGKRQISMGYSCELSFEDGVTPEGKPYQAVQHGIKINHLAIVDQARGGEKLTVEDERTYSGSPDGNTNEPTNVERQSGEFRMPHTLIIDGLQVTEVSDQAKAAIEKLQGQVRAADEAKSAAETKVGELTASVSTKDGEIAALNKKLEDAKVTPQQLEQLATDRAELISQAKAIHPELVTDGKTEAEIRKAVVDAKLGDVAKDFNDDTIAGAFKTLAKDVKPLDPVRNALSSGVVTVGDAEADYDKAMKDRRASVRDAWKGEPAKAA